MFSLSETIDVFRKQTKRSRRDAKRRRNRRILRAELCEQRMLLAGDALPFEWVDEGPAGTINGQLERGTGPDRRVTGAIHTVLAHPTDPNTVYIGAVNGGIWKTTDFTSVLPTWTPQTDFLETLSIGAMAFDPTDATSNTLVAGTAKYSSFAGFGGIRGPVFMTTDGGNEWTQLPSAGLRGENISGIAVRGDTIVVTSSGTGGGLFRSTDGGASFVEFSGSGINFNDNFTDLVEDPTNLDRLYAVSPGNSQADGVYRSDDFGVSWTRLAMSSEFDNLLGRSNNSEMAVSPTTGRLYVATLVSGQPRGIFYSSNPTDASPTWTQMDVPILPIGSGRALQNASNTTPIVITSAGHGLNTGNFVVVNGVGGNTAANGFFRVTRLTADTFRLDDSAGNGAYTSGGTWTRVTGPNPREKDFDETGAQGRIHFSIAVDPTNENILYIGGDRQDQPNSIGDSTFSGAIFRGDARIARDPSLVPSPQWDHATHDSGIAFDPEGGTANGTAPHADSREIVFDAAGNLVEVDDGGVFIRTSPRDNTGDWISKAGSLGVIEFHDVAYDSLSNILMGGTQDNGTHFQQSDTNKEWDFLSGGDGGDVAVDNVTLAGSNQSIRYSSSQNLGGFARTTWDENNRLLSRTFISRTPVSGARISPTFKTPVQLNDVDPTRMLLIGSNGIFESDDQGDTTTQISTASPGFLQDAVDYGGFQNGVPNEDVLYVGLRDDVHIRTTAGGTVTRTDPDPSSSADIRDVVMNSDDWANAFAIDNNDVFQTIDAGLNWEDITGNLMSIAGEALQTVMYVPGPIGAVVVGGSQGVFASRLHELGTWVEVGANLPNALVFDLIYNATDDILVSGTLGRGVWSLPDASVSLGGPELLAVDQNLRTIEDVEGGFLITGDDLLAGTLVDGVPITGPQNEVFVQSITSNGQTIDSANRADIIGPQGGTISPTFDDNGYIIELLYTPLQDFNSENLPANVGEFLDETFMFTIIEPAATPDPLTSTATASIRVTPQNDAPIVNTETIAITDADYLAYYENLNLTAPVPTEDAALTIPYEFLLQNDSQGPTTAQDEIQQFNRNDGPLQITDVVALDPNLVQSVVQGLNSVTIVPQPDVFGEILFTYVVQDSGINQAAELDANGDPAAKVFAPMRETVTASIFFEPVNDAPVAVLRGFTALEAVEGITDPTSITITETDLLFGTNDVINPGLRATASDVLREAPFNEDIQDASLRVNSITSSGGETLTDTGTIGLESGGTLEVTFDGGFFSQATYLPPVDFNQNIFPGLDTFSYTIVDNGQHEFPVGTLLTPNTPPETSEPALVGLLIEPSNDFPVFDFPTEVHILERDDNGATSVPIENIAGGPATALDEQSPDQEVTFEIVEVDVPAGLMNGLPDVSSGTSIEFFPAPDQIGSAVYRLTATDDADQPLSISQEFTITIQPVNDAPTLDGDITGTAEEANPDLAYSVADDGVITYTLREDNTQDDGSIAPFFIPLFSQDTGGYDQIGILDVFSVGPENESVAGPGGAQVMELVEAGNDPIGGGPEQITDRGGLLTPVFDANDPAKLIGLSYTPPADFNSSFAGIDSFTYIASDGGTTYNLGTGEFDDDAMTIDGRVEFVLNAVNDAPEFVLALDQIAVQEDSTLIAFENYGRNISAGPATSAFDEVDLFNGQTIDFTFNPVDFDQTDSADFFSVYPQIDTQTGRLIFQPAPDVFGDFRFEVSLMDDGPVDDENSTRGDRNTSEIQLITISVQPINDPPVVDPAAEPLVFELMEDNTLEILVSGDGVDPGLLDVFLPGPTEGATDETSQRIGGDQTVSLSTPIPRISAQGGTLTYLDDGGQPRFLYRPRANFVGMDSFIYTVIDDGVTVGLNGEPFDEPRIASNIVRFNITPVNDEPIFSGATSVFSLEDEGLVTIPNWATNVQAGPSTAFDELNGFQGTPPQDLEFVITQIDQTPSADDLVLFSTPPEATIDPVDGTATLTFEAAPEASGTATFTVSLRDFGEPRESSPERTFQIDIQAVNDPPTFTLVESEIVRDEDSGPFSIIQAVDISPGPANENNQTVAFEIEPLAPEFASLFANPPTINSEGRLRFTPAPNQNTDNPNGPAILSIVARDSDGQVSEPQSFQVRINEVNDAPRAVSDSLDSDEDTILVFNESVLKENDIDPDLETNANEEIRVVMPAETTSVGGAKVLFDAETGTITYDPTEASALQALRPNEPLVDSFAYSLVDALGTPSNLVTVAVNLTGVNDAPRPEADAIQLALDGPTVIPVLDNDIDVDGVIVPSSVTVQLQPAFGTIEVNDDGSLIYRAFTSFSDTDIFEYTVRDNLGAESEPAVVTIIANLRPIATDDGAGTFLEEPILIPVADNDFDPDGGIDLTSIEILSQPERGEVIAQPDGTVRYVPDNSFIGRDEFTYRIFDLLGRPSLPATVETRVVSSRLQNPVLTNDVNNDGFVTAIDALLVVNHLDRNNTSSIPVVETDQGPNFFDTSGDQLISVSDALRVINALSRGTGAEGEQVLPPSGLSAAEGEALPTDLPMDLNGADKICSVDGGDASFLAAVDVIAEGQNDLDEDDLAEATDAALTGLV